MIKGCLAIISFRCKIKKMIDRELYKTVQERLKHNHCVAILGPRQVGKTTMAREIADSFDEVACYLDLQNPDDIEKLKDPVAYFSGNATRLIVLDEIQKLPEIFSILRGQIDERRRMGEDGGKFLILGSASMELLRQSSESLTGRISLISLGVLNLTEVLQKKRRAAQ